MESRMFDNHPSLCRSRHARFHHFFVLVIGLINDISMTELGLYLANKQGRGFQYKGILKKPINFMFIVFQLLSILPAQGIFYTYEKGPPIPPSHCPG